MKGGGGCVGVCHNVKPYIKKKETKPMSAFRCDDLLYIKIYRRVNIMFNLFALLNEKTPTPLYIEGREFKFQILNINRRFLRLSDFRDAR